MGSEVNACGGTSMWLFHSSVGCYLLAARVTTHSLTEHVEWSARVREKLGGIGCRLHSGHVSVEWQLLNEDARRRTETSSL